MPIKVGLKYIDIWKESMEDEVYAYEKRPFEKNKIVFYGPSYFTRWSEKWGEKPLEECILGKSGEKCAINRGFGSSCSEHQLYFYPRMIKPLEPNILVYGPFGNGRAFGYSIEEIWEIAQRVIVYAKTDFPDIKVYICGAQPKKDMSGEDIAKMEEFDNYVKSFVSENEDFYFVDIMGNAGMQRKDIYVEDGVHLNHEGYKVFAEIFNEALKSELEKF